MLQGPFDSRYRIVGIDPGTDTLGVSNLELDLRLGTITLLSSQTCSGHQLAKQYPMVAEKHTGRFARLTGHRHNLPTLFHEMQPHGIACEAPYMGRFPQAYAALTECVFIVRQAVMEYNPYLRLWMYDPPTVKKSVGVGGKSGDKDAMKKAVSRLPDLFNPHGISYQDLDEHSIDSIAVAYCRAKEMLFHLI